jgi:hypothetical protein
MPLVILVCGGYCKSYTFPLVLNNMVNILSLQKNTLLNRDNKLRIQSNSLKREGLADENGATPGTGAVWGEAGAVTGIDWGDSGAATVVGNHWGDGGAATGATTSSNGVATGMGIDWGDGGAATGVDATTGGQIDVKLNDARAEVTVNLCAPLRPLPNSVMVPRTSARKPRSWLPPETHVPQIPTARPMRISRSLPALST